MTVPAKRINLDKLAFSATSLSTEDSLRDVVPMLWAEEVRSGAKRAVLAAATPG